ncbi:transcription initiation factor TFIID subunit 5 [Rhizoctonia solani]|uniref:Transcription initiation factor TFIID subunit 5 n=1 Tax=Rhizoctonia solani TaxID=456999 RepID=A0A8H8P9H6_9AGAM|nr:transcription initiation factor TFIID subunit 5 [Rhizoctonia solani]QRW26273.1 transcription initiation factor TFIID subunit 5 [Rhizoctonia solani]
MLRDLLSRRQIHSIFGQEDSTIRFVNGSNGAPVLTPLKDHTAYVTSLVFTRSSKHLFLGSSDGATRTRNVSDGTPATKPLEGPHCPVNSVAISPDGATLGDLLERWNSRHLWILYHTVRVWNFSKGLILPRWFEDQMSDMQTAIFSAGPKHLDMGIPARIAYFQDNASADPTQNVNQRYPIIEHGCAEYRGCQRRCRAVQGHPDMVTTASFSHDDTRLATASKDRTVRVCSIESGELASGPFTGCTDKINSVTFSLDESPSYVFECGT